MLLRAFRSLMPKEERFVDQFVEQARHIAAAAIALEAVMESAPDERPQKVAALKRVEKDADRIAKDAGRDLHRAFITPFDRSDILSLINALDDAIDLMDEVPRPCRPLWRRSLRRADAAFRRADPPAGRTFWWS